MTVDELVAKPLSVTEPTSDMVPLLHCPLTISGLSLSSMAMSSEKEPAEPPSFQDVAQDRIRCALATEERLDALETAGSTPMLPVSS